MRRSFAFRTEDGQDYSITSNTSTNPPEFREGDVISSFTTAIIRKALR